MTVLHEGGAGGWLEGEAAGLLGRDVLPPFLLRQRWFAGKARELEAVGLRDATPPGGLPGGGALAIIEARFRDGAADLYLLPLVEIRGAEADRISREDPGLVLARVAGPGGEGLLIDALADVAACAALLEIIASGRELPTRFGRIRAEPTGAFTQARGPAGATLTIRRGKAEQSNSAILYGDRLILKVFRRLEPGRNPDLEIGRYLTEQGRFDRIPRTAGSIEYDGPEGEPYTLAILQGLVANEGTGWEHALDALRGYFGRASALGEPPPAPAGSALDLADQDPPAAVREAIGAYLGDAATLGRRTAEMHRALAAETDDPAFRPEPLTADDLAALAEDIRAQVRGALEALRANLGRLSGTTADDARRALDRAPGLLRQLERLPGLEVATVKARVHGDYHLGQVLRTGADFVILDFEGEPARPLARRREKASPIKDVVGMLRSFDYAAYAGLFAATADRAADFDRLAPWARAWRAWTEAAFLRAYRETAAGAAFLPADPAHLAELLRAYTLDKALYELQYELNNRPDWVRIPLQGVLALIEPARAPAPSPSEGGPNS